MEEPPKGSNIKKHGLRFKPFHEWFKEEVLNERVPKGPDDID